MEKTLPNKINLWRNGVVKYVKQKQVKLIEIDKFIIVVGEETSLKLIEYREIKDIEEFNIISNFTDHPTQQENILFKYLKNIYCLQFAIGNQANLTNLEELNHMECVPLPQCNETRNQ